MNIKTTLQHLENRAVEYAFYYKQRETQPFFQANCERFSSASIIKVPLLLTWLHLERQGLLDRGGMCDLDAEPQVQGAGFSWLLRARSIPWADVLLMMISLSDNLCTNLIIRHIGLPVIGAVFDELGFKGTALQRKLMDYEARDRGLDNWVSATDCIRFYELIEKLPDEQRAFTESILEVNQDDFLLKRDIPRDTVIFHHKTGSIPHVLHDWGYTRNCQIFLLTQNISDENEVFPVFGALGRLMQTD